MSQELRTVLHSAFSAVRSGEVNKSTAALTLDHLILEQIKFLKKGETRSIVDGKGESVGSRISRYDQLDNLLSEVQSMVAAIKAAGTDEQKLTEAGIYTETAL